MRIIEHKASPRVVINTNNYIDLYIRPNSTTKQKQIAINNWYRSELKKTIPNLIEKWEKKIGVKVSNWQIRQMKTKWGSCNIEKKQIIINLELAKKPIYCLEYVILHELIHLIERNHNERYIKLLDYYYPNWRSYRNELNMLPLCDKN